LQWTALLYRNSSHRCAARRQNSPQPSKGSRLLQPNWPRWTGSPKRTSNPLSRIGRPSQNGALQDGCLPAERTATRLIDLCRDLKKMPPRAGGVPVPVAAPRSQGALRPSNRQAERPGPAPGPFRDEERGPTPQSQPSLGSVRSVTSYPPDAAPWPGPINRRGSVERPARETKKNPGDAGA
jgi:hypothetical protein